MLWSGESVVGWMSNETTTVGMSDHFASEKENLNSIWAEVIPQKTQSVITAYELFPMLCNGQWN